MFYLLLAYFAYFVYKELIFFSYIIIIIYDVYYLFVRVARKKFHKETEIRK